LSAKKSAVTEKVTYNHNRLFWLSVMALATSGMVFGTRAAVMGDLQKTFFETASAAHAGELIGAAVSASFLGLAIAVFIASPLCDYLGMGRLLGLASFLHIAGLVLTIATPFFGDPVTQQQTIYWVLWIGMLLVGLAHGLVEAVINPLTASVYPDDKTRKLNILHAWWPGGIIIGGLLAAGMAQVNLTWQWQIGIVLIPAVLYGAITLGTKFPPTERIAAKVPASEMIRQAFRPAFILMFICMFLTASSELAPGQWVDASLTRTVHLRGIYLLCYVSGLMFVMRHFAGPLVHKFSPIGLLWLSSLLAGIGLFALSYANSPLTGLLAATAWGIGVCYMWPTMLGVTSERFPKGGALLMGLMGAAGMISVKIALPVLGWIYDKYKVVEAIKLKWPSYQALSDVADGKFVSGTLPGDQTLAKLHLNIVDNIGHTMAWRWFALLPVALLLIFGCIWLWDKSKGGYKAIKITHED
jgi:MFS family permease